MTSPPPKTPKSKAAPKATPKSTPKSTSQTAFDQAVQGLSVSETRVLLAGQLYPDQPFKVDYEKVAAQTGYTTGSARTVYNNARRKFLNAVEGGSPTTKKSKRGGRTKKAKTPTPSDNEEDDDKATDAEETEEPEVDSDQIS